MKKVKVLVPVSGGKDSQACLHLACSEFGRDNVRGLFCDTRFEHPITYKHVEWMREHYGIQVDTVTAGDVLTTCQKYGRFPGGGARHCTDELKIKPTKLYMRDLAAKQSKGFQVWFGMRLSESSERANRYSDKLSDELYPPHEVIPSKYPKYLAEAGVMFRMPILEWSSSQVLEMLGANCNPLYFDGFDRVGCFPCLASGDRHKEKAFFYDDFGHEQEVKVMQLAKVMGKSIWTSSGGEQRNNPDQCKLFCS